MKQEHTANSVPEFRSDEIGIRSVELAEQIVSGELAFMSPENALARRTVRMSGPRL